MPWPSGDPAGLGPLLPIGDIFRRLGLHFHLDFCRGFGPPTTLRRAGNSEGPPCRPRYRWVLSPAPQQQRVSTSFSRQVGKGQGLQETSILPIFWK